VDEETILLIGERVAHYLGRPAGPTLDPVVRRVVLDGLVVFQSFEAVTRDANGERIRAWPAN
jgi:hypothetical protein